MGEESFGYEKGYNQQRIFSQEKAKQHMLYLIMNNIECLLNSVFKNCGGGAVGKIIHLASERLSVQIPAATDLSR